VTVANGDWKHVDLDFYKKLTYVHRVEEISKPAHNQMLPTSNLYCFAHLSSSITAE